MTGSDTIASLAVNAWINGGWVVCPKADLFGANLSGADLRGANLFGCDLRWAELIEADLRGCDLSGAKLIGANLRWAKITLGNRTFTLTEETAR